ncbi:MAG: hypothetical protein JW943_10500 [Deltaproteobacteria bacterium]|nr:hypothetical protein [Deltaproteobacteria bacterium]
MFGYIHPCRKVVDMSVIELNQLFEDTAKISELKRYIDKAVELAGNGNDVILTGPAPVWLYLKIAHALHGKVRTLVYRSPATGDVVIFDHNPF